MSRAWARTLEQAELFAQDDSVLVALHGPPGSGKTQLAQRVHRMSPRAGQACEMLDLASLDEHLAGSQLFGHERGAYTGAVASRKGQLELAHRGTLFLDEFAKASRGVQRQLLTAIEYGTFQPLGASSRVETDVRFIVAYNEDLPAMVGRGEFLGDLYERVKMFVIDVPPLSERRADIPGLVLQMVARRAELRRRPIPEVSEELVELLRAAPWPGNLRELNNAVIRIMLNARGDDRLEPRHCRDVPGLSHLIGKRTFASLSIDEVERLVAASGKSAVAEEYCVDRTTVHRRLKRERSKPTD